MFRFGFLFYFGLVVTTLILSLTQGPELDRKDTTVDNQMVAAGAYRGWDMLHPGFTVGPGITSCVAVAGVLERYCTDNPYDPQLDFWMKALALHQPKRNKI